MLEFVSLLPVVLELSAGLLFLRKKTPFQFAEADGDDSDIKIAGKESKPKLPEGGEEAKELDFHRRSGNLDRARLLGSSLAGKILDEDGGGTDGETGEERIQRRLLLAFTVQYAVENAIPSSVLGHVVLNEFYDSLKKSDPEFYEDIGQYGSFSFYYLCIRRGDGVGGCIGRSFAMLLGRDGDPAAEGLGEALFTRFLNVVTKEIRSAGFAAEP